ncbi:ACT domain-containing protein [Dermacoccaceae bacterium W4C1]
MSVLHLIHHPEELAVVRLDAQAVVPDWAMSEAPLVSVSLTAAETSVVCLAEAVPRELRREGPFRAHEIAGDLRFDASGVLESLLHPLSQDRIPVFTVSTLLTTWILVDSDRTAAAHDSWRANGHIVEERMI